MIPSQEHSAWFLSWPKPRSTDVRASSMEPRASVVPGRGTPSGRRRSESKCAQNELPRRQAEAARGPPLKPAALGVRIRTRRVLWPCRWTNSLPRASQGRGRSLPVPGRPPENMLPASHSAVSWPYSAPGDGPSEERGGCQLETRVDGRGRPSIHQPLSALGNLLGCAIRRNTCREAALSSGRVERSPPGRLR